MKSAKLTKSEIAILVALEKKLIEVGHQRLEVDKETGQEMGLCWLTAQRATLYEPRLMYHEGYFRKSDHLMHHAWNTLNGKLVDLQTDLHFHNMHLGVRKYHTEKSYTSAQVNEVFLSRKLMWNWIDESAPATKKLKRSKANDKRAA